MKKQIGKFTIDSSITFGSRILQLALGIGTSVIIARVLGPQGKGTYSLAILLPSLLATLGNFGIPQASVFYVGKKKYLPGVIFANNIILSILLGIICFLIGLMIILFFRSSLFPGVAKVYLFLALFLVPLNFFINFVNYLLLGLQKIKEFNFVSILQSFVFLTSLSVFLLMFKFGIKAAIISNILSCSMGIVLLLYLAKRIIGNFHLRFNKSYFKDAFKYGVKVYLGNIIGFLHYRADMFLINIFLNPIAVGFYSIATTLAEKIWLVSQSAGTVLFPKVSSEINEQKLKEFTPSVCRNVLLITFIGTMLLFFLGKLLIVLFYSEKFLNSVLPFQILLIGSVTMSGWRVLANDLYGRGRPELNIYISVVSVVLNVILNIIWIPRYRIAGAAWATSVSYTFAFIAITIVYTKISGNCWSKVLIPQQVDWMLYRGIGLALGQCVRRRMKALLKSMD